MKLDPLLQADGKFLRKWRLQLSSFCSTGFQGLSRVDTFYLPGLPDGLGFSGRMCVEWWPDHRGMTGRMGVEYTPA